MLVSTGQLKQIAGRAGRRNSAWGGTGKSAQHELHEASMSWT